MLRKENPAKCLGAKVEAFKKVRGAIKLSRKDWKQSDFQCRLVW